jgi:hypothetical protein
MDYKTLGTILFRVLGVSYLLYGVFYAPYLVVSATFNGTFIMASLSMLTYVGPAICLLLLSRPLAALIAQGFDRNSIPPPPPQRFEN